VDLSIVLHSGIATGTVLLSATIGELLCEQSGVLNLGVEGMMLIGAMSAFSVAVCTGSPWLALIVAMVVAGMISLLHSFATIQLQPDQVVSGLSLTFLGTGLSLIFGEGPSKAATISLLPSFGIPLLERIPLLGPILFGVRNPFFYNPYLGFFLQMVPYAFTVVVLVLGSREAARKAIGAPAALGLPYVREEPA